MATHTNNLLDKLHKKYLIPIVLSLQNKLDELNISKSELLDAIRKLNEKFNQLQSDVYITVNVYNLL